MQPTVNRKRRLRDRSPGSPDRLAVKNPKRKTDADQLETGSIDLRSLMNQVENDFKKEAELQKNADDFP